jgi:hypothetical protein
LANFRKKVEMILMDYFEKSRNDPNGLLRVPGDTDS